MEFHFSAPSRNSNGLARILAAKDGDTAPFPASKRPSMARRTQSLHSPSSSVSSASSSSSSPLGPYYFSDEYSPPSPATPFQFSRVPFSWEKLPGIPKKQATTSDPVGGNSRKGEQTPLLAPPPPASSTGRIGGARAIHSKSCLIQSARVDPFFAALVECSKDVEGGGGGGEAPEGRVWRAPKSVMPRNSSHLFGAMVSLHGSCKRTCDVSESIVYLPSPRRHAGNVGAVGGRRRR